jgi:HSP20 family protein
MSTLVKHRANPVAELLNMFEVEPLFGRVGGLVPYLLLEDFVDGNHYVIRAEMPGVDPEHDVDVSVVGDILTIRGERKEEHHKRGRQEFRYGAFERSIQLPKGAETDRIQANYSAGVLELRVPFTSTAAEARRVPITHDKNQI